MRGRVRMVCGILFRLSSYYYVQFSNGKACTFIVKRGRDWLDDDTHYPRVHFLVSEMYVVTRYAS